MRKIWFFPFLLLLFAILTAACTSSTATSPTPQLSVATTAPSVSSVTTSATTSAAPADGKTLLESRCVSCHSLAKVVNTKGTEAQWKQTVDSMIQRGAQLTPDEETVLVQYLAANFK